MNFQESFASFKAQRPEWLKYETRANCDAVQTLAATITPDLSTATCWCRAFDKLLAERKLTPLANYREPILPVSREFRQRCASLSSSEVRRLYSVDPEFHEQWDRMSLEDDGGTVREVPDDGAPVQLSAIQYKQMDPNLLARLLQNPTTRDKWQAAINKLIAEGTI